MATFGVLIGRHSSEVLSAVVLQSVCISRKKKENKKSNILYSVCIMILFLIFITILGEWVGMFNGYRLHMYFYMFMNEFL